MNMKNNQYVGRNMLSGLKFELFSQDGAEAIHHATMDVLENCGVLIGDEEALQIYKDGGCDVNFETGMVKIPESVVKKALLTVPSRFYLYGRDGVRVPVECRGKVCYTCFGTGIQMCRYKGEGKFVTDEATSEDLFDCGKIVDWAENIDFFSLPVTIRDYCDNPMKDVYEMYFSLKAMAKHFHHIEPIAEHIKYYWELAKAFYGGDEEMARNKPLFSMTCSPTSPLEIGHNCCQVIIQGARLGVPVDVISMAMSGGTSTVFVAGTLVTHNAEVLAGIVLSQLTKPGAKCWYGSSTTCFDLVHGTAPVGAPELALISASVVKLGQYYNMPSFVAGV